MYFENRWLINFGISVFKFKEKVEDRLPEAYMKTDFYLIRWLRVKEYDISEAERMLMLVIHFISINHL